MNSPDREWWIEQSGEYVLGTLSHSEWLAFRKAAEHDKDAQRLIMEWEQTFQPLADALQPVKPPLTVWADIKDRISAAPGAVGREGNVVSIGSSAAGSKQLQKKIDRWRSFAGLATAASILLASLAWVNYRELLDQPVAEPIAVVTQFDSIAIVRNEESLPLWVVDTALSNGLVRVTAIAPPAIDDTQSYQLWLVKPDDAGVQSMGLIPTGNDESLVLTVQTDDEDPVAFAVSLEAAGGSAADVPTGPVLYQGVVQNLKI